MERRTFLKTALAGSLGLRGVAATSARPNILLILADDVGYSDLGCYGGEVHTPNLDRLASGGLRFTQFYNAARCCPSRASILTGLYSHQVGLGNMTGTKAPDDMEGYTGRLSENCATIPEVLRPAGYSAYMTGKWHLGEPGPVGRGFQEYYGLFHGFDSCWDSTKYTRLPKDRPARAYPPGTFYSTNAITDYTLDFLAAARKEQKPFFTYLAYNAAHFPLHAPKETIDKYVAVYEKGWDKIREERFTRMRKMGLLTDSWEFTPRSTVPPNRVSTPHGWANKQNPSWESIEPDRRADLVRRMSIYSAMIEIMDRNIGRVIEDLRSHGELDNTLVLFLSDNGACAEWDPWGFDGSSGPDNILHKGAELDKMGQPGTYHSYGSGWANACNTPWRFYKHYDHEGGISTPFIAHWPAGITRKGELERQPAHIIDLMPTCAELAGAKYPSTVPQMEGRSLKPAFSGKQIERDALYWEHEGSRAIRIGKWKAVALLAGGDWELYDMEKDRTEMHNLALSDPKRVSAMARPVGAMGARERMRCPGHGNRHTAESQKCKFKTTLCILTANVITCLQRGFSKMSHCTVRRSTILLASFLILVVSSAFAQSTTSQILGRIVDSTGAVVPGAHIAVENQQTGAKRETTSSDTGAFAAPLLPPGEYRITVQKDGFRPVTQTGITLQVDQVARLDFSMEVGAVNETVNIVAEAPLLDQQTSSLGEVIDTRTVENIPLNGRSPFRLVQLTPGVLSSPSASGQFGDIPVNTTFDTNFSINGGPNQTNEILIDGVPSTTGFFNQITTIPSVDATQEFKVQSSGLSAEYGRFGGGVIDVTTKSGTNALHGSLFEFVRNDAFDANDFFNNQAGKPQPAFRMNQFGGAIGGPIVLGKLYNGRNRTFFFADYQGTAWRQGSVTILTLPTDLQTAGKFSADSERSGPSDPALRPHNNAARPESARTVYPRSIP